MITIALDYEKYIFEIPLFISYMEKIKEYIKLKITKNEILTSNFHYKSFKKLTEKQIKNIKKMRGDRVWNLAIKMV